MIHIVGVHSKKEWLTKIVMGVRFYSNIWFTKNNEKYTSSRKMRQCIKKTFSTITSFYKKPTLEFYHCRETVSIEPFLNEHRIKKGVPLTDLLLDMYIFVLDELRDNVGKKSCWCLSRDRMTDR